MGIGYTELHVDRKSEQAFRRRAIKAYPREMMEVLWGRIIGSALHIYVFMPIEQWRYPTGVSYHEEELDHSEDQALDEKLELLGTIHTHPDQIDCAFSPGDIRDVQDKQDTVMAICAVTKDGKGRISTEIVYWHAPREFKTIRTKPKK